MDKVVIKRKGHNQEFDERKVYASAYAAALNCHHNEEDAEMIGETVAEYVKKWLHGRDEVKASEIKKVVKKTLKEIDKDVAMMYETYMELC